MKFATTRAPRVVTTTRKPIKDPLKEAAAIDALLAKYQPIAQAVAQAKAVKAAAAGRLAAATTAAKPTANTPPRVVSISGRASYEA